MGGTWAAVRGGRALISEDEGLEVGKNGHELFKIECVQEIWKQKS